MRQFFSNTVATDTIPLKLVVYLGLLAAILLLLIQAWHTAIPVLEGAEIKAQTEAASMSILSIQGGYARNSADLYSPEGSIELFFIVIINTTFSFLFKPYTRRTLQNRFINFLVYNLLISSCFCFSLKIDFSVSTFFRCVFLAFPSISLLSHNSQGLYLKI
jgi:hypothetical protein